MYGCRPVPSCALFLSGLSKFVLWIAFEELLDFQVGLGEQSSAIQILPMPEPRICLRDLWTGGVTTTSLTAGLPARAMMTSSPLSTAAMSLERWVLA